MFDLSINFPFKNLKIKNFSVLVDTPTLKAGPHPQRSLPAGLTPSTQAAGPHPSCGEAST